MKPGLKLFILFLLFQITSQAICQQRIQFSQYMVNQYILNPAAGGIDADLDITLSYRNQWVNFNGGPVTYYFSGNIPIKVGRKPEKNKPSPFHSAGVILFNDQTGPISKSSVLGSYSYNLPVLKNYRLAAGVFAGLTELRLDQSQLKFDEPGESFNYTKITVPDGSIGLWFYNDKFYLGSSVNQLFYNSVKFIEADANLVFHYYLTSGYKIPLGYSGYRKSNPHNFLVPSVMFKYGGWGTSPSVDLNLKFNFLENFWVGTSYRHLDSQVILGGVKFKSKHSGIFELAYSYDYTLSKINTYTSGSHEITLKYKYHIREILCPSAFW